MIPYAKQTVNLAPPPPPPKKETNMKEEKWMKISYYQDNITLETTQESGNINENGKPSTINNNTEKHQAQMQNVVSCLLF